jgi:hypothetical protein
MIFRWKQCVMFTVIYCMRVGEIRFYWNRIMFIVVLNVVAASFNNSNLQITFYSQNCVGEGNYKFIIASYLQAITNFLIHSVTQKIWWCVTYKMSVTVQFLWLRKILREFWSVVQSCSLAVFYNYRNCTEERRAILSSRLDCDSFLDLREISEQTAVNCTVDMGGVKL